MTGSKWKKIIFTLSVLFFAVGTASVETKAATVYRHEGTVVSGAYAMGIDVSKNNGVIDWQAVKKSGVEFAIIRCGYGSDLVNQDDSQWEANVTGCEKNGIPYGVYLYSYADTKAKAVSEARHVLRLLKGHRPAYPVYFDMEDSYVFRRTTAKQRGQIAAAFCEEIKKAGYKTGIYSSKYYFERELTDPVFEKYGRWVAQWNRKCTYSRKYQMWQASKIGRVNGINGYVDVNYLISSQIFVKPSLTVKSIGKKQVQVRWKPKQKGSVCEIYYSTKKKGPYKKVTVNATKGKKTIKKLKRRKKYYFKVRIRRTVGRTTVYSRYSACKKVKIR